MHPLRHQLHIVRAQHPQPRPQTGASKERRVMTTLDVVFLVAALVVGWLLGAPKKEEGD
jgi:hypothetical protein